MQSGAQGGDFILNGQIGHAGLPVHHRPAKLFRRNIFAQYGFDDTRAGQTEKGVLGLNHKTSLAGEITASAGIETEHAHNAGDHTADLAQGCKGLGITVQAADTGRHKGSGAIVHPDHRNPFIARHLKQAGQFFTVGGIHRTGPDGEVMPIQRHIAAIDIENSGHKRSPVQVLAPVLKQDVGLAFGQNLDPLPDCHSFFEVLFFDLADADRFDRAFDQIVPFLHRLFVAAGCAGNLAGDVELHFLNLLQRVFQYW